MSDQKFYGEFRTAMAHKRWNTALLYATRVAHPDMHEALVKQFIAEVDVDHMFGSDAVKVLGLELRAGTRRTLDDEYTFDINTTVPRIMFADTYQVQYYDAVVLDADEHRLRSGDPGRLVDIVLKPMLDICRPITPAVLAQELEEVHELIRSELFTTWELSDTQRKRSAHQGCINRLRIATVPEGRVMHDGLNATRDQLVWLLCSNYVDLLNWRASQMADFLSYVFRLESRARTYLPAAGEPDLDISPIHHSDLINAWVKSLFKQVQDQGRRTTTHHIQPA